MTNFDGTPLSQRLEQGAMSPTEAARSATLLADALRQYHDRGTTHGSIEPCRIILGDRSAALLDGASNGITPYSSPEQVQGGLPDMRSDIYAFGAIVYEMVSGRKPFCGADWELRNAILELEPAPLPAAAGGLARLVGKCLAKSPSQRPQRMQNVQMELKLLNVMARRSEPQAETAQSRLQTALRAEIAGLEERVMARLASLDQATAELRTKLDAEGSRLSETALAAETLRGAIASLQGSAQASDTEHANRLAAIEGRVQASDTEHANRLAALEGRVQTGDMEHANRLAALEGRVQAGDAEHAGRLAAFTEEHARIDRALAAHASSIESLGTALTQSDDLIERLVDAFDSLERSIEERHEGRAAFAGTA